MPSIRLNRFLLTLSVIGLLLYSAISFLYGRGTEPELPTDNPAITKKQAADSALAFLKERYRVHQADTYVVYQSKKERSGYLQKENLISAYLSAYNERYPIDYYEVSAKESSTGRRFTVDINYMNSAVIGWHEQSGSTGEAPMNAGKADLLAKVEMRQQGLDPADFAPVERASTEDRAAGQTTRYYEKQSQPLGEAKLQLQFDFDGTQLTGYTAGFSLPASYTTWLEKQDASASRMTWVSLGFSLIMTLAAIFYVIRYRKAMRFSRGLLLTAIYLLIYIGNNFNMYPAFRSASGDMEPNLAAWASIIIMNIVTVLMAISLYLALVAGEGLWRLKGQPKWLFWRERTFGHDVFYGMGRGYLLALFILGIQQVLFYAGEIRFDVWSVNDPTDSVLNMVKPQLFPTMAWVAAISEEAVYRLLGVVLFKKLFRSNFIAVLLPSVIWAASHTQYPIYPVYTRLIEVTIIGIILGYVFLKYGFITALFAHTCMDSILMGLSLFSLGGTFDWMIGLMYIALPGLISWGLAWLHGKRRPPFTRGEPPRLEGL
ncbi:CPBP family intramembrane glutamic endopeptidase [Paenibacillus ferrarius]|uniref:CPBP family intramembrane glutamic endopeptidase n=1 Tax=Paenibacillus ferrarius TaxID=1469647 RepID=UPI003D2854E1